MKRYRIIKIARGAYEVMVIAPDGEVAVISGFRRETDAQMWIVEETMKGGDADAPKTTTP
jgi:hypothetical protein